jgi:hypothetical protein
VADEDISMPLPKQAKEARIDVSIIKQLSRLVLLFPVYK